MKERDLVDKIYGVPQGIKVRYEIRKNGGIYSEMFPDGEFLPCVEIAWKWAELIYAVVGDKAVNIHVVKLEDDGDCWIPVSDRVINPTTGVSQFV